MKAWIVDLLPGIVFAGAIAAEIARQTRRAVVLRMRRWIANGILYALGFLLVAAGSSIASFASPPTGTPLGPALHAINLILCVFALDLLAYLLHRLQHAFGVLWRFHEVHHSDADVDATTALRHHPVEAAIVAAAVMALAWLLAVPPEAIAIYAALSLTVQIIQHADLDSRWQHHPLLAWILITPAMHRRHHERDRATSECNYGAVFSIWDRVFGTLQAPDQHVAFGVDAAASPADANWLALLRAPLRPRQSMPALRNP